jgi:hypothetical protein
MDCSCIKIKKIFKNFLLLFEKESNHSITESINRKEPEMTTEESIEIINTSKKARPDGRKSIENPTLFFEDIPDPDPYEISNLKLSEGTFVFSYLGELLSLFEPDEFPAGKYTGFLIRIGFNDFKKHRIFIFYYCRIAERHSLEEKFVS